MPAVSDVIDSDGPEVEYADIEDGDSGFEDNAPEVAEPVADTSSSRARDTNGRFAPKQPTSEPVAEPVVEREPVVYADTPVPDDGFDETLLTRAEQYGFSKEDARDLGSPEALNKVLAWHDRKAAEWGLSQLEAQQAQQAQPQPVAPQPVPVAQTNGHATNGQAPQPATGKYKVELDPDIFDEDTIKTISGLNDNVDQRFVEQDRVIQALLQAVVAHEESLTQTTGQSQAEQEARVERDMDSWFAKLGDEWSDEFGTGPVRDLPPGSPQLLNRQKVARQMKGLMVSQPNGQGTPDIYELANRAHGSLYYQQIQERARKQLATQAGSRRGQSIARAAGKNGRVMSPDEVAKRNVAKFMQQFDATLDDDEDDGL